MKRKIKVKITIYGHLLNGKREFHIDVYENAEIRHCFYELFEKYPEIRNKIFTKSDNLKDNVRVLLNGNPVEDLRIKVKNKADICVFPVSAGG